MLSLLKVSLDCLQEFETSHLLVCNQTNKGNDSQLHAADNDTPERSLVVRESNIIILLTIKILPIYFSEEPMAFILRE